MIREVYWNGITKGLRLINSDRCSLKIAEKKYLVNSRYFFFINNLIDNELKDAQ